MRRRVRELGTRHPVLEWLFGRFVLTEEVLREWALSEASLPSQYREACHRILQGNGYEQDAECAAIQEEVNLASLSAAGIGLLEHEKPTLLIVDDDQLLLRTTRRVLGAHYRVLTSHDPIDALQVLKERHVDAIVSDYDIPNTEGGLWLLERVGERFPDVARILISSRAVPREISGSHAVERFVHKNASLEELVRNITECLEAQ